jgi:hypothetical protein
LNRRRLAPIFLILSVILVTIDFLLPSGDELGLLGFLAEWGLLALSLLFLVLFAIFRGRSF